MGSLLVAQLRIRWLLHVQSYERIMKMQDEQEQKMNGQEQSQEQSMEPTVPETAAEEPKKEPEVEHDAVSPGEVCKACGWKFGDPAAHIVNFGALRQEPDPPIVKATVPVKESDPKACEPVSLDGGKCPKCGWSATDPETRANPHPVLL